MKKLIVSMLVIVAVGCAPKILTRGAPEHQNLDGVIRLIGRSSYAHACPVDGLVLSAGHVVQRRDALFPALSWPMYYAWEDQRGSSGYLQSFALPPRDLGVFRVHSGIPTYYRHATEEPQPGDILRWLEWDLRSREKAFAPRPRHARFLRAVSGHLVLDDQPTRGGSGSCVLNTEDEVVAIVTWHVRVGIKDGVGMFVSVAGPWWPGGRF